MGYHSSCFGIGLTLEDAFEDYEANGGEQSISEVSWFECEEIQVEVKVTKKQVPIKTKITPPKVFL